MAYLVISWITLFSAAVGLFFAVQAVRGEQKSKRGSALYMFSRSLATVLMACIPFVYHASVVLVLVTGMMMVIQFVDGLVGIYIKDRLGIVGPLVLAIVHAVCLWLYL